MVITLMSLIILCKAQSGWVAGNIYQYQGEATTTCGYVYNVTCTDYYGNVYICGRAQNCRTLVWEQQYYSGYIYLWGPNGWYTEWHEGYYWSCYWNDWVKEL